MSLKKRQKQSLKKRRAPGRLPPERAPAPAKISDESDESDEKAGRLNIIFLKNLSFEEMAAQKAKALLRHSAAKGEGKGEREGERSGLSGARPRKAQPGGGPPEAGREQEPRGMSREEGEGGGLLERLRAPVERAFIETAFLLCQGNQTKAADCLGMNRNILRKRMDDLQIPPLPAHHVIQKHLETSGRDMIVSSYEELDLEEAVRRKLLLLWEDSQKIPNLTAEALPAIERALIEIGLKHAGGRKTKAAALLGLSRMTLAGKIKLYKL